MTRRGTTGAPIDLDRTEVRRIAAATLLLIQRTAAELPEQERSRTRQIVERRFGLSGSALSILLKMPLPWRIMPDMLARLERALGVPAGHVLAGRCEAPAHEEPKKSTVYRCERVAGGQSR